MKIKAFIAEDEPNSMERLRGILQEFPELEIVGEADNGLEAIKLINILKPELVFLDIQMPGIDGFGVLRSLKYTPKTVFVTAFDQYAIKAFEENAIDYILKPISRERIKKVLNKISHSYRDITEDLLSRLNESIKERNYLRRFIIKSGDEILIYPEKEVFYFKSEDKYTFLYLEGKRAIIENSLKELEASLDPDLFCRIHKNCIVSLDKILKLKKWFHNEYILYMKNSERTKLKVSRNYKKELIQRLKF